MAHDTTAEAARIQIEALARLSGEVRLRQALELSDFVFEIHRQGKRARAIERQDRGVPDSEALGSGPPSR